MIGSTNCSPDFVLSEPTVVDFFRNHCLHLLILFIIEFEILLIINAIIIVTPSTIDN